MGQFLSNVAASLVAASIIAIIGYLYRQKLLSYFDRLFYPVEEFSDIEGFIKSFKKATSSYNSDFEDMFLVRLLPTEISDELVNRCIGSPNKRQTVTVDLQTGYSHVMEKIILGDNGSNDLTIFGKTSIKELDEKTHAEINKAYFNHAIAPDTTELGFHDNLNEFGIILLGKAGRRNPLKMDDYPKSWEHGFLFIFSEKFDSVCGYYYKNHTHIATLYSLFQTKRQDASAKDNYVNFYEINGARIQGDTQIKTRWTEFRSKINNFYT